MAMRVKRRQAPSFFFSNLSELSPAVRECRQKKLDEAGGVRAAIGMFHLPFHFVRDHNELKARFFRLNSSAAPAAAKLKR